MTNATSEQKPRRLRFSLLAVAMLLVATGARLFGLTREAFWVDEVITFDITRQPGLAGLKGIAELIHPPIYFLGVAPWREVFGSSEFALRGYSVAWSIVAVVATMLFAFEVGKSRRVALWAGWLTALSPLSVYFAQEARMYTQASALVALSSWALAAWMSRSGEGRRTVGWAVIYVLSVAALLLTQYVGLVVALAQGIAVIVVFLRRRNMGLLVGYAMAALAVTLLFLPWLRYVQTLRSSLYRASDLAWIPSPGWRDVVFLFTRDLVWGSPGWTDAVWIGGQIVALGLTIAVLWVLWSDRSCAEGRPGWMPFPPGQVFVLWMAVGPVVLALIISWLYHPVLWYPRFCTLILPPVVVMAACAVESARARKGGAVLPAVLVVTALVGLASQHQALTKGGMRNFARYWNTQGPPDVVCIFPKWKRMVARYEMGTALAPDHGPRLKRRLEQDQPFTVWICSHSNYDSVWRPEWERRERQWILSLGEQRRLDAVDRMEMIEVRVSPGKK